MTNLLYSENSVEGISLVMPTFMREELVLGKLNWANSQRLIRQVIVVVDGGKTFVLEQLLNKDYHWNFQLQVIPAHKKLGAGQCRNIGIEYAEQKFTLVMDDDDFVEDRFCEILYNELRSHNFDLIGAAWFNFHGKNLTSLSDLSRGDGPSIDNPSIMPRDFVTSPFLPCNFLAKTEVLRDFKFDSTYAGNGYREETDLFVRILKSGKLIKCSPNTYSYSLDRFDGGYVRKGSWLRIKYEFFAIKNTFIFIFRHGNWLRRNEFLDTPLVYLSKFVAKRISKLVRRRKRQ